MTLKIPIGIKWWGTSFIERGRIFPAYFGGLSFGHFRRVDIRLENREMNKRQAYIMKKSFRIEFDFPLYESDH